MTTEGGLHITWEQTLADNRLLRAKMALVVDWAAKSGTDVAGRHLEATHPFTVFLNHINNVAVLSVETLDTGFYAATDPLPWLSPRQDSSAAADLKMMFVERMFLINVVTAMEVMLLEFLPSDVQPRLRKDLEGSINRFLNACLDQNLIDPEEKLQFGFAIGVRNDIVHRDGIARSSLEATFRETIFKVEEGQRPEVPVGWLTDLAHMVCLLCGPLINRISEHQPAT